GRWSIAGDGHFSPRNERGYRCGGRPPNSRNRRTAKAHGTVACAPSAAHTEHDPEKWVSVFGKRSCSTKRLERDDDSSKSHPALGSRKRFCKVPAGAGRSGLLAAQDQLARVGIIEQRPGALVEHVGIDALGLEQRHAAFPDAALGLERGELS